MVQEQLKKQKKIEVKKIKKDFIKINDFTDINSLKDSQELNSKKTNFNIQDKKNKKSILNNKEYENVFYTLASTSDKIINGRTYNDESTKKLVEKNGWVTPYNKPLLPNHDAYRGEPKGRILENYYVNHSDLSITTTDRTKILPIDVIDFFEKQGCFENGTGSTILKCFCDHETMQKIKDGYYLTVSQGIYVEDVKCNICGEYFWDCEHRAGITYKKDNKEVLCVPECCGEFEASEISIVNVPANDTSIIYVPRDENEQEKKDFKLDNYKEEKIVEDTKENDEKLTRIDDSLIVCKDDTNDNMQVIEENNKINKGDSMLKDVLRDMLLSDLKKSYESETVETVFTDFFNSLEDEKIENFTKLLNEIKKAQDEKIQKIQDSIQTVEIKMGEKPEENKTVEDNLIPTQEPIPSEPVQPNPDQIKDNQKDVKKEEIKDTSVQEKIEDEVKDMSKLTGEIKDSAKEKTKEYKQLELFIQNF